MLLFELANADDDDDDADEEDDEIWDLIFETFYVDERGRWWYFSCYFFGDDLREEC